MLPMGGKHQMYFSGCGMFVYTVEAVLPVARSSEDRKFVFGVRNMVIRRDVRKDSDVANKGSSRES